MRRAWPAALVVLVLVVVADQLSKRLVRDGIAPGDERHVLPGLRLVHSANHGIAFGLAIGGKPVTIALVALVLLALLVHFARNSDRPLLWLATGLIAGGAVGNLIDRLKYGAVTDFVQLPLWPAFNVADAAISVGVLTLIYTVTADAHRSSR